MGITKGQATEFYRDLCGTYNGNASKTGQGIASVSHIAESMHIPLIQAQDYCAALIEYGITERQGGGIVI